jgi:outer membrane usher protein
MLESPPPQGLPLSPAPKIVTAEIRYIPNYQATGLSKKLVSKALQPDRVTVPWWINDRIQGNILINIDKEQDSALQIFAPDFLLASELFVNPEVQKKLVAAVIQDEFLSIEALREQGIAVIFDRRRLELRIQVPAAQRRSNISQLQTQAIQQELASAIRPSQVSGYLNLRGSQGVSWTKYDNQPSGRRPIQIGIEGAVNLNGWVLESDAQFTESKQIQRGNVRLVRDDTKAALRYVVGDFSPPVTGYQTSQSMLGVAIARNYSLQPERITLPISQFQFFLERKSRVEVLSNGRSIQNLILDAGTQDLRDLPLSAGVNDVQLVITDDLGQVKRLDFAATTASNLLAPGLQQFAYSLGIPSKQQAGNFTYNWQKPTINLAYRWGVNSKFTTGAYLQANSQTQMLGWEGYWATPIGMINWDSVVSQHQGIGTGMAIRLRHDYTKIGQNNPNKRAFGIAAEFQSQNFMRLNDLESVGNTLSGSGTWLDLNAYYSQRIFNMVDANFNLRYQLSRNSNDAYQASMGLSKGFKNGLTVGTKISYKNQFDGRSDTQFVVDLNWRKSSIGQSFQASSLLSNQSEAQHRFNWDHNSGHPIGGLKTNLGLDFGKNIILNSRVAYTNNYFNLEFSHDSNFARRFNQSIRHESQLQFASAIVFANGEWAISRPVTNSFAMIVPHKLLKGQSIGINPDGRGGYAARVKYRAAVIPDLSAYQLARLNIDAPNLPIGVDLGQSRLKLLPTYKSGTLIKIGQDPKVFLRSTLVDDAGAPIIFGLGEVVSLSEPDEPSMKLFTNKVGRFILKEIKPGRYVIRLNNSRDYHVTFEIPSGTTGAYNIGSLKLKHVKSSSDQQSSAHSATPDRN